jgi:hypothetical protein
MEDYLRFHVCREYRGSLRYHFPLQVLISEFAWQTVADSPSTKLQNTNLPFWVASGITASWDRDLGSFRPLIQGKVNHANLSGKKNERGHKAQGIQFIVQQYIVEIFYVALF